MAKGGLHRHHGSTTAVSIIIPTATAATAVGSPAHFGRRPVWLVGLVAATVLFASVSGAQSLPTATEAAGAAPEIKERLSSLERKFEQRLVGLQAEFSQRAAAIHDELRGEIAKWMQTAPMSKTGEQLPQASPPQLVPPPPGGGYYRIHRSLQSSGSDAACATDAAVLAAKQSIKFVCCDQRKERCGSNQLPTSCDSYECAVIVETVQSRCDPWLAGGKSMISGERTALKSAAAVCKASSPPPSPNGEKVFVVGKRSSKISTCSGILRSQSGGNYDDAWTKEMHMTAPPGFSIKLTFRALDIAGDGDLLLIYENETTRDNEKPAYKLKGRKLPKPIISVSNQMVVRLLTDKANTAYGFSAQISCVCKDCHTDTCIGANGRPVDMVCGDQGHCDVEKKACKCNEGYTGAKCQNVKPVLLLLVFCFKLHTDFYAWSARRSKQIDNARHRCGRRV